MRRSLSKYRRRAVHTVFAVAVNSIGFATVSFASEEAAVHFFRSWANHTPSTSANQANQLQIDEVRTHFRTLMSRERRLGHTNIGRTIVQGLQNMQRQLQQQAGRVSGQRGDKPAYTRRWAYGEAEVTDWVDITTNIQAISAFVNEAATTAISQACRPVVREWLDRWAWLREPRYPRRNDGSVLSRIDREEDPADAVPPPERFLEQLEQRAIDVLHQLGLLTSTQHEPYWQRTSGQATSEAAVSLLQDSRLSFDELLQLASQAYWHHVNSRFLLSDNTPSDVATASQSDDASSDVSAALEWAQSSLAAETVSAGIVGALWEARWGEGISGDALTSTLLGYGVLGDAERSRFVHTISAELSSKKDVTVSPPSVSDVAVVGFDWSSAVGVPANQLPVALIKAQAERLINEMYSVADLSPQGFSAEHIGLTTLQHIWSAVRQATSVGEAQGLENLQAVGHIARSVADQAMFLVARDEARRQYQSIARRDELTANLGRKNGLLSLQSALLHAMAQVQDFIKFPHRLVTTKAADGSASFVEFTSLGKPVTIQSSAPVNQSRGTNRELFSAATRTYQSLLVRQRIDPINSLGWFHRMYWASSVPFRDQVPIDDLARLTTAGMLAAFYPEYALIAAELAGDRALDETLDGTPLPNHLRHFRQRVNEHRENIALTAE